jgi:hypothetical protein
VLTRQCGDSVRLQVSLCRDASVINTQSSPSAAMRGCIHAMLAERPVSSLCNARTQRNVRNGTQSTPHNPRNVSKTQRFVHTRRIDSISFACVAFGLSLGLALRALLMLTFCLNARACASCVVCVACVYKSCLRCVGNDCCVNSIRKGLFYVRCTRAGNQP